MSSSVLIIAVFLASSVEMVEALTIVLAAGTTHGWRSALQGTFAALGTLALLVLTLGTAIVHYVPIATMRVVIGALLLIFGMQWLRKAILRSAGLKAMHNEDQVYRDQVEALSAVPRTESGFDSTGFVVSFKGVFLEGLEVVIIVITLGASSNRLTLAAITAISAAVIVALIGAALSRQLSQVPENKMKMGVGIMLTSFGTFWTGEGLKVVWPGSDASILGLIALFSLTAAALVRFASTRGAQSPTNA